MVRMWYQLRVETSAPGMFNDADIKAPVMVEERPQAMAAAAALQPPQGWSPMVGYFCLLSSLGSLSAILA
jgi:hypothetical protein